MKLRDMLFLMVILSALLVACGAEVESKVTLLEDEAWEAELLLTIPEETLALWGSREDVSSGLDELAQEAEMAGVDASWRSEEADGAFLYTIKMKGQGLEKLSRFVFDDHAEITVFDNMGERQIRFFYVVAGDILSANSHSLTLTGGEIISTNGNQLDEGTVQWVDPSGRADAVLTEKGGSSAVLGVLIILLLGMVVAGGGLLYWRRKG